MKKFSAVVLGTLISSTSAFALSATDLAFTSYNSSEDGWSIVTFVDIPASSTIFFTDNEYVSGAINGGESFHRWSTGSSIIVAGTVVRFRSVDNATTLGASVGTLAREAVSGNTNYGISQTADMVYAYEGTAATAPTTFLAAASSEASAATTTSQLTGTGLSIGSGAVYLGGAALYRQYTGVRSGLNSFADYKALVYDASNWSASVSNATAIPNTAAFTITPIPEASEISMMLAGLGVIGAIARRRNRA